MQRNTEKRLMFEPLKVQQHFNVQQFALMVMRNN